MATDGFAGFYVETRDYTATAAFWRSLGFESVFETGHGSGQLEHPTGGPYVFINEHHDGELETHPILTVLDSTAFAPVGARNGEVNVDIDIAEPFTPQHWGVVQAILRDPDGRNVSLQAPLPDGVEAPDADAHHDDKYGSH
jgi:catechol 2,3-dioxygenase-like lactoylglutathione lyase family enzyme